MLVLGTSRAISRGGIEEEIKKLKEDLESIEPNQSNQPCIPSKTDEEPLEVIKLDDDVVYNLKPIDTNEFK